MVKIPAGCFQMGSKTCDFFTRNECPQHEVCLDSFWMDMTEVTQGAYRAATGGNPSKFSGCGNNCPVEQVNWGEAQNYCESMGKRLPTEAEWEFAARAGTTTRWYWSDEKGLSGDFAWDEYLSEGKTRPVGLKKPNAWGLHDLSGNVWEWTSDWYGKGYYSSSLKNNPQGPASGSSRVCRGGRSITNPTDMRSAYRGDRDPETRSGDLGFRCVSP
jgi:formylglycine-generating enzyme required for sulfatase activity